jgi:hypothetical protein
MAQTYIPAGIDPFAHSRGMSAENSACICICINQGRLEPESPLDSMSLEQAVVPHTTLIPRPVAGLLVGKLDGIAVALLQSPGSRKINAFHLGRLPQLG